MARADLPLHTDSDSNLDWYPQMFKVSRDGLKTRLVWCWQQRFREPGCTRVVHIQYIHVYQLCLNRSTWDSWMERNSSAAFGPACSVSFAWCNKVRGYKYFMTFTPFTHQLKVFFSCKHFAWKRHFWKCWLGMSFFLHRMRICCKKNDPFNSQINVDIPELSNCKHLEQSQWLCRMDITSPKTEHPRTSDYEIFLPLWSPCQISY